jgi:N-acyl homoserine lactone hydrolase
MAQLKIHELPLLKLDSGHKRLMYLSSIVEPSSMYASIFYIEGATKKILVDAGGSAEAMQKRNLPFINLANPTEALKRVGVSPDEIDIVICTHLHIDHNTEGHLYKNARFIVQKAELEDALNPHPIGAPIFGPRSSFENLKYEVVEGDKHIVDGIKVLFTPGHTLGNQSVLVETAKGKVIISGLCTTRYNFYPQEQDSKSMSVIPPSIHVDVRTAYDSLMRIKKEADIIVPLHCIEQPVNIIP